MVTLDLHHRGITAASTTRLYLSAILYTYAHHAEVP